MSDAAEPKSSWGGTIIGMLVLVWFLNAFDLDLAHSRLRYALQYSLKLGSVSKDKKPRDCDWLRSPLGNKDCHFEVKIETIKEGFDEHGAPVVSYDDGATWNPADGIDKPYPLAAKVPTIRSVNISWEKLQGEE